MNDKQQAILVQRATAGDPDALQALLAEYHGDLRALMEHQIAAVVPAGRIDPEDILQDAYVAAFRTVAGCRFDGPRAFHAWLERIVLNRLADESRPTTSTVPICRKDSPDPQYFRGVTTCHFCASVCPRLPETLRARERAIAVKALIFIAVSNLKAFNTRITTHCQRPPHSNPHPAIIVFETYALAFLYLDDRDFHCPCTFLAWLEHLALSHVMPQVATLLPLSSLDSKTLLINSGLILFPRPGGTPASLSHALDLFAQLTVAERKILRLRFFELQSVADIAIDLKTSVNAVHAVCRRALSTLRNWQTMATPPPPETTL